MDVNPFQLKPKLMQLIFHNSAVPFLNSYIFWGGLGGGKHH